MSKENLSLPMSVVGNVFFHGLRRPMPAPHHHDELELNLVLSGRAAYLLGDQRYDLTRHSLLWLFPGQDHILLDQSLDYQMWIVLFKKELLDQIAPDSNKTVLQELSPTGRYIRQISGVAASNLDSFFRDVASAADDTAWFNAGVQYALHAAWSAFSAAGESASGADIHPAVEKAVQLLRDETEILSAAQLAAEVGVSAAYLSRLFHQQTGVTLVEFRNRQRILRFLKIYGRHPRPSAIDAALEAGFGSYAQFHRVFRAQIGCSPQEYSSSATCRRT